MKTLIWTVQVERRFGTEVTDVKYFYLLIFSLLCTWLNTKQQSSNVSCTFSIFTNSTMGRQC